MFSPLWETIIGNDAGLQTIGSFVIGAGKKFVLMNVYHLMAIITKRTSLIFMTRMAV